MKSQDKAVSGRAKELVPVLEKLVAALEEGKAARSVDLTAEDIAVVKELNLITLKKTLYLCNVDEDAVPDGNEYVEKVKEYAAAEGAEVMMICGKLE